MNYEETIELEENIKIKNRADKIYENFLNNVKLDVKKYYGNGEFLHWADQHNQTYFVLKDDTFSYICHFLHETYNVIITPSAIFSYLKNNYKGVKHLEAAVRPNK